MQINLVYIHKVHPATLKPKQTYVSCQMPLTKPLWRLVFAEVFAD